MKSTSRTPERISDIFLPIVKKNKKQMPLSGNLGPPPALYTILLGGPTSDCMISINGGVPVAANEDRMRLTSPYLSSLLSGSDFQESRLLQLQLLSANAELTFSRIMTFLNTGEIDLTGCTSEQMLSVADECHILSHQEPYREGFLPAPKPSGFHQRFIRTNMTVSSVEVMPHMRSAAHIPASFPLFSPVPNPFMFMDLHSQTHVASLFQIMMSQFSSANQSQEVMDEKVYKKRRTLAEGRELKKAHSLDSREPYDNLGDVIIPSTDKEGWCRNKKYIEKTDGGFMCMVCKKVYGRYNSVSYHVTIYHRNPPIKCDIPGCQFTTREARYIHFHKYYRHGIALPDNIDQGSRRCPYCRHVSKSPAMLDKHVRRHQLARSARNDSAEMDSTSIEVLMVDGEEERGRGESLSLEGPVPMLQEDLTTTKPRAYTL